MSSPSSSSSSKKQLAVVKLSPTEQETAISQFCHYLQFETVSATAADNGEYSRCAAWLLQQLQSPVMDDVFYLDESPQNAPVVIAQWKGQHPHWPVLLLNSHYDVVPAVTDDWTIPPFGGIRHQGKIYGRGTQDMKSVGMQYLQAIRHLRNTHPTFQPLRTIVLTYVPDEEVGGAGMAAFLNSSFYQSLPGIALALDEGLASTTDTFSVFYGERVPWFVQVQAHGPTGHGSRFIESTAVEQLLQLCDKAMAFRTQQRNLLLLGHLSADAVNCTHAVVAARKNKPQQPRQLGDVTSLNITSLEAGVKVGNTFAYNCVPPHAQCSLDIRIAPYTPPSDVGHMLDEWCRECNTNATHPLSWTYLGRGHDAQTHAVTSTDPMVNPWYGVFCHTMAQHNWNMEPQVFPAATDSRFLRALGIRALGFSPMRSTPTTPCDILLHEDDECIPEATFLEGIAVYVALIQALGSFQEEGEE